MKLKLIFRKKLPEYFSLENVFGILLTFIKNSVSTEIVNAETHQATPAGILKNFFQLRKVKGDVIHVTGDIHYAVFAFPAKKVVLTIHDCVFLYNTKGIRRFVMLWFWHIFPVRYASIITTISEATKKDIIRITGCRESKVKVIANPVDPAYKFHSQQFNSRNPVILQVGTWPNKNLDRVVESLKGMNCRLSVIGKLSDKQKQLLTVAGIDFSNHFSLSKEELMRQYIECDVVLFASTFEGFGLPVLEAQATGRPLVTSGISPMTEVAGKGAHFVDPFRVESIRAGISKIVNDESYRKLLVNEGLENVKKYHPNIIASQYLALYKQIAATG